MAEIAVVAGYVVRCPLAGYAWQALHYLAGLRALGFDAYFYEDTAYYGECFDPVSGEIGAPREAALAFAAEVFAGHGFSGRWIFWDAQRDRYAGIDPDTARAVLSDAKLAIGLAAVNRLPRDVGRRRLFVDIDPGVTQIQAERDRGLRELLDEYDAHFTIGENIGRPECLIPTGGRTWHPTRQPIALDWWAPSVAAPNAAFTTIGRWNERRRVQELGAQRYSWSKRDQWLPLIDLPRATGARFELAMDVDKTAEDGVLLRASGWNVVDPLAVSIDAGRYHDYICTSRAEFSVAKELNVRLASGWFSDRSACYLAAGRPVVVQDTGFRTALPSGAGLLAFSSMAGAVDAVRAVVADWPLHSAAARGIAEKYFAAPSVLAQILDVAGV